MLVLFSFRFSSSSSYKIRFLTCIVCLFQVSSSRSVKKQKMVDKVVKEAVSTTTPRVAPTVLARRTYFLNARKDRYISFGFYSIMNYIGCAEVGNSSGACVIFSPYLLSSFLLHLPKLCENISYSKPYLFKEESFRVKTCKNLKECVIQYGSARIHLRNEDISYLVMNSNIITDIMNKYILAQTDVFNYVNNNKESIPTSWEKLTALDMVTDEINHPALLV